MMRNRDRMLTLPGRSSGLRPFRSFGTQMREMTVSPKTHRQETPPPAGGLPVSGWNRDRAADSKDCADSGENKD